MKLTLANKKFAAIPAIALAAGISLAACGSAGAPAPTPTVTVTAPAAAPSTTTPTAAPTTQAPVNVNNNPTIIVQVPPPPTSTVYVPVTPEVPAYVTDNEGIVQQYYADLSNHDYLAAWNLGGNNLNHNAGYDQWVAGYATTVSVSLGTWSYYPGSNAVEVTITALQSSGAVNTYQGSYTVSGGVIVGANIVQTG
jgi:hypothetical protein